MKSPAVEYYNYWLSVLQFERRDLLVELFEAAEELRQVSPLRKPWELEATLLEERSDSTGYRYKGVLLNQRLNLWPIGLTYVGRKTWLPIIALTYRYSSRYSARHHHQDLLWVWPNGDFDIRVNVRDYQHWFDTYTFLHWKWRANKKRWIVQQPVAWPINRRSYSAYGVRDLEVVEYLPFELADTGHLNMVWDERRGWVLVQAKHRRAWANVEGVARMQLTKNALESAEQRSEQHYRREERRRNPSRVPTPPREREFGMEAVAQMAMRLNVYPPRPEKEAHLGSNPVATQPLA